MDAANLLNFQNLMLWLLLGLVIAVQGELVGNRWAAPRQWRLGRVSLVWEFWPERQRWQLGYITLFGSSLVMVLWFGWDAATWAGLALLAGLSRLAQVDRLAVGNLWERKESHRWTLQYFAAFAATLPLIRQGRLDLTTAAALFVALGVCGAVKAGREAWRESRAARQLRRHKASDYTGGDYGPTGGF